MAGYTAGADLIATCIRAHSSWNSDNCVRENWNVLQSGKSSYYAIIRPLEAEMEWITVTHYVTRWRAAVEVWQKHGNDQTPDVASGFGTRRDQVIAQIVKYPDLGDTTNVIADSKVVSCAEPEEMWREIRGGQVLDWLKGDVIVEWTEETTVSCA